MRHQRFQVNQSFLNQRDCLGIGVVVSVLEAEVYFFRGEMHERDVLNVFANANDENLSAECRGLGRLMSVEYLKYLVVVVSTYIDGRVNARFNTSALQHQSRL